MKCLLFKMFWSCYLFFAKVKVLCAKQFSCDWISQMLSPKIVIKYKNLFCQKPKYIPVPKKSSKHIISTWDYISPYSGPLKLLLRYVFLFHYASAFLLNSPATVSNSLQYKRTQHRRERMPSAASWVHSTGGGKPDSR